MSATIGIDFGTAYTCVSACKDNSIYILDNFGEKKMLNYVKLDNEEQKISKNMDIRVNYNKIIYYPKIFLATKNKASLNNLNTPFQQKHDSTNERIELELNGRTYAPEEVTSIFLKKSKSLAESFLKTEVNNAVITVPSNFTDSQRKALLDSARIAGLNCMSLLNDTTASAIAYAYDKKIENRDNILIFDLGAYYLNMSLVSIENGHVVVRKSSSYSGLGGIMYDHEMVKHLLANIKTFDSKKLNNSKCIQTLLLECKKAKENLTNESESFIEIESLVDDKDLSYSFTRTEFELMNKTYFDQIFVKLNFFLKSASIQKEIIEEIILFGGSSRIFKIQSMLREFFVDKPLSMSMNASESVAYGAGIHAARLARSLLTNKNGFLNKEACSFNYKMIIYKLETKEGEMLVKKGETLPAAKSFIFFQPKVNKKFCLKLYENENFIFETDYHEENLDKLEIELRVDINGNVNIRLGKTFSNSKKPENIFIMKKKIYCLDEEKVNRFFYSSEEHEKNQVLKTRNLELKNKLEKSCYELKSKLKSLLNKNNNIENKLNELIKNLSLNMSGNYEFIQHEINHLKGLIDTLNLIQEEYVNLSRIQSDLIQRSPAYLANNIKSIKEKLDSVFYNTAIAKNKDFEYIKLQFRNLKSELDMTNNAIRNAYQHLYDGFSLLINQMYTIEAHIAEDIYLNLKKELEKHLNFTKLKKEYEILSSNLEFYEKNFNDLKYKIQANLNNQNTTFFSSF